MTPGPVEVDYPGLLEGSFSLLGYPLPTVIAEKVVTMIDRGTATTREPGLRRRRAPFQAPSCGGCRAACSSARHGRAPRQRTAATGRMARRVGPARQASWSAYVARSGLADLLPADYSEAIATVAEFVDPLLIGAVTNARWDPLTRRWTDKVNL